MHYAIILLFFLVTYLFLEKNISLYIISTGILLIGLIRALSGQLKPLKNIFFLKPWIEKWYLHPFIIFLYHVSILLCAIIFFYDKYYFADKRWGFLVLLFITFLSAIENYNKLDNKSRPENYSRNGWKIYKVKYFIEYLFTRSIMIGLIYVVYFDII
jgi:hypothetical protein